MFLLSSLEHAFATAANDLVKLAKFVEAKVLPELQKASASAATIESVTALVSPQAANIERTAFAVLGVVIKAIQDAGAASLQGGLNIKLDETFLSDLKAIVPTVTGQATVSAAAVPTQATTPATLVPTLAPTPATPATNS
jgi:hypothetical protein